MRLDLEKKLNKGIDLISVIVVDDSPINRKLMERKLHVAGHSVITAESGDAVELLNHIPKLEIPHCAVVDKDMPGMSGVDCAITLTERGSL